MLARSNVVFEGYWTQPEATAEAIVDGWFHTGDGGTIDDEHYLTIVDRKKDVIISGGENVSSIEVEDALFKHPAVAEVAVIGVPDEKWGETVKALVVLAPGASVTEEELIGHCKAHLADYKCPTSIEFPRRARPHRHRQAPEVQAPRALLGRPRPPGQLIAESRLGTLIARCGPPAVRGTSLHWTDCGPVRLPTPTLRLERRCWAAGERIVVGIDEVGRGAWAGPVTVAAVVPGDVHLRGVRDSKQLHSLGAPARGGGRARRGRAASASGTRHTTSATRSA